MVSCFVIMPFGEKMTLDGQRIDFDAVYHVLVKGVVEHLGIRCTRCDDIRRPGWIHADMFQHIWEDDIVVVDITTLNANVFYELGVRHALKRAVTVLIRQRDAQVPFNVQGFRIIDYDLSSPERVTQAQQTIAEFICNGLQQQRTDSPVHAVLRDVRIERRQDARHLTKCQVMYYKLTKASHKRIALITGGLQEVKVADIWVNSENTNMQMARYHDHSVSGVIRYLGATKDRAGYVLEDTIAEELKAIMGHHSMVPPATVLVTEPGELAKTHNVKKIFHAASVMGRVGEGYHVIPNVDACITEALRVADSRKFYDIALTTILFPLMGTGTARENLYDNAKLLLRAAISYLEAYPESLIECAYFSCWTDKEFETCQAILRETDDIEEVVGH